MCDVVPARLATGSIYACIVALSQGGRQRSPLLLLSLLLFVLPSLISNALHMRYAPSNPARTLTFLASAAALSRSSLDFWSERLFLSSVSGTRTSFAEGTEVLTVTVIL